MFERIKKALAFTDGADKPDDKEIMESEIAKPRLGSVRSVWHGSTASGLTPYALGEILNNVDRGGDPTSYLTLAEEMEERDGHYRSVLSTRKLAVSGLNLVVEAATKDPKDIEEADFVREALDIDTIGILKSGLLDALGKGVSAVETVWDQSSKYWVPKEFIWRDPRFFLFDRDSGEQMLLKTNKNPGYGEALPLYKFAIHKPELKMGVPIRGGLARVAALSFMCKGYSLKDWLAFAEVFGMPFRLGKHDPSATDEEKSALLRAVSGLGSDSSGIIPDNMMIEFVETDHATGGDKLFQGLADWLDKVVTKVVLGQTASVDGTPGRLGNDEEQGKVRDDIRIDDADKLAGTIRRDIVKPIIDLNFGTKGRTSLYPRIKFVKEEKEDLVALSKSLPEFIDRGLPVEVKTILDKFDLPMPDLEDKDLQLLGVKSKPAPVAPTPEPEIDAETARSRAFAALLHRVERGEQLSETEKEVLALCAEERNDTIDDLADERMKQWRDIMGPVLEPLFDVVESSDSFEEVETALANFDTDLLDVGEFVRALATENFKARAMGDATDRTEV